MRFSSYYSSKDSFTLVELLVVIGILAILTAAVVIVLNPAELLKQSRDSKRTTDLAAVNNALKILLTQNPEVNLGTASTVYVSLADSSSTCGSYSLPTLPSGWQYRCVTAANLTKGDGTGWIPVSFASGASQLPALPLDPQNDANGRLYYSYAASNGRWELISNFESDKYAAKEAADGGVDPAGYEIGSATSLLPFASGLVGYWNFDEMSGTVAYDGSGFGANATMYSSTTPASLATQSGCKQGGCASFDGIDDYAVTSAIGIGQNMAWMTWVKATGAKGEHILDHRASESGVQPIYSFGDGMLQFHDPSTGSLNSSSGALSFDSAWHHIAVVGTPVSRKIYYDGALIKSDSAGIRPYSARPFFMGTRHTLTNWFKGNLDDVRIYSRALSDAEIKAIYDASK